MHVLFVHNDYGRHSGEEEAAEGLATLLVEHGHRVSWMRKSSAGIEHLLAMKVKALGAGIWSPSSRREMRDLIQRDRPDVVQVQNLYPFISSSVLSVCRQQGIPIVMRCPNYRLFCPTGLHLRNGVVCEKCLGPGREWNCLRYNCEGSPAKTLGYAARNAFNRLTGSIVENVDRFLVLSEFQRSRFEAGGIPASKLAVLPNVAPVHVVDVTPVPMLGEVVYAGRFSREKGVDDFFAAARRLPEVPFAAAGDPADLAWLASEAPPNVRFAGFLKGKDLDRFYEGCRLFVCPSRWYEGFPNVVARAMAHGRPVVGTRIGAIPEIVKEGTTGLLYPPGDVDQLVATIDRLWGDLDLCASLGRCGRQEAERRFTPEVVRETLIGLYRGLLANTPAAGRAANAIQPR